MLIWEITPDGRIPPFFPTSSRSSLKWIVIGTALCLFDRAVGQGLFDVDTPSKVSKEIRDKKLYYAKILEQMAMANNTSLWINQAPDNMSMEQFFKDLRKYSQPTECLTDSTNTCEDSFLYKTMMGYLVLPLAVVCVLGNTFNFAVYTMEYFTKFVAVKMLAAKAIMNTLFVIFLLPKSLRTIGIWNPVKHEHLETIYWVSWPYLLTAMNTVGTCAMWVTVLMTLERFLYIVYPSRSRQWVTNKNFYLSFIVVFLLSLALHSVYLITRHIVTTFCSYYGYHKHRFMIREQPRYTSYEKVYFWSNLFFAIVIPLILLIFMSTMICYRLVYKQSMATRYSEQKRCINRITFSTTVAHLVFEMPTVVIFAAAALGGPKTINEPFLCYWHIVASFLTICNASVMFFIYTAYSVRFRQMFFVRVTCGQYSSRDTVQEESVNGAQNKQVETQSSSFSIARKTSPKVVQNYGSAMINAAGETDIMLRQMNGSVAAQDMIELTQTRAETEHLVPHIVISCDFKD